jgi:hypothetical protein
MDVVSVRTEARSPVLVVRRHGSLPVVLAAAFDPKGRCSKVLVDADAVELEIDHAKIRLPLRVVD